MRIYCQETLNKLKTRYILDEPLCIDKITLSIPYNVIDHERTEFLLSNHCNVSVFKRNFHLWIIIHGEYLHLCNTIYDGIIEVVAFLHLNACIFDDPEYTILASQFDMYEYFFRYICISDLEIAYNFRKDQIDEDVFNNLRRSIYSLEKKTKRIPKNAICAYNRQNKLREVNQYKKEAVEAIKYPYRIEFRFMEVRCKRLNLFNLQGSVSDIANRYFYLAWFYKIKYFPNCPDVRNFDEDKKEEFDTMMMFYYVWEFKKKEYDEILQKTTEYREQLIGRLQNQKEMVERIRWGN